MLHRRPCFCIPPFPVSFLLDPMIEVEITIMILEVQNGICQLLLVSVCVGMPRSYAEKKSTG
jgi:hypothetical protein